MPLLTVDQAADRFGTSPRFIRCLVAERRIGSAKLGKHVHIDSADLDAFVAAERVAPAGPGRRPGAPRLDMGARAEPCRRPVLRAPGRASGREDDRGANVGYKTVNRGDSGPRRRTAGFC